MTQTARKKWPETAPYNDAIKAFDAALTRAARDKKFRDRLTASPASAKEAVADIGNIDIPADRVIVFYEPKAPKVVGIAQAESNGQGIAAKASSGSTSSENVHVFYLPPLNENDTTTEYKYETYFMCCYDQWLRT